jgi:D-tyrosyl-tRNA(Tyr) deacylase
MRILVQRIAQARVEMAEVSTPQAGRGLLAMVGFAVGDNATLLEPMARKLLHLRVLADEQGRMNRALVDAGGHLVLVSQFTLYADSSHGRRPSLVASMPPQAAEPLYARFVEICGRLCDGLGIGVITGQFGAMMQVHIINDGPVTILLDSAELGFDRQSERRPTQ